MTQKHVNFKFNDVNKRQSHHQWMGENNNIKINIKKKKSYNTINSESMNLRLKVLMNINAKHLSRSSKNNDHLEKIGTMKRPVFSLHH